MLELLEELPPIEEMYNVIDVDFNVNFVVDFLRPATPSPNMLPNCEN